MDSVYRLASALGILRNLSTETDNLMVRLNIAAKVWLSIGIFILGFVATTVMQQIQGLEMEEGLRTTDQVLYPAALGSHEAEASFQQAMKAFSDAVVLQEKASLEHGADETRHVIESLQEVAEIQGLKPDRATQARRLALSIEQFLISAQSTYGNVVDNPVIAPELQTQMLDLAFRTKSITASLRETRDLFARDLQSQLGTFQARSARLRWLGLSVFGLTLVIATVLVNLTIRRVIARPLLRAEAELAHERDLLRILLDNIPDCIYFKDAESRFIRVNKAESVLLGVQDEKDANGHTDFDFFDVEHAQQAYADEREIIETGRPLVSKIERVNAPDSTRWLTATKVPIKDDSGQVTGIVGVSRDITDWKEAVESLKQSEASFRLLFAAIPHAVWVFDIDTLEFLEVNESAIRHYGYSAEEFRQIRILAVHSPEEYEHLRRALTSKDPAQTLGGAWKHQTKDGRILDVEVGVRAFEFRGRRAVMAVVQDVGERKHLEVELRQAQRLESVGQLAAGIAHEINTPIQYVGDNIRFLRDAFECAQPLLAQMEHLCQAAGRGEVTPALLAALARAVEDADLEYLNQEVPKAATQSLDGVERVATIVRAMKEFAHPGRKEKTAADLNQALQNTLIVARNELKYVADVETDFGELPPVVCHIGEMNQVFLNLLINAGHAIGEVVKGSEMKGRITVRTKLAGDRVVISISDTGCGVPAEIQSKVFDLFFTTKAVGKGTGQGLALARSIVVEKHGGSLTFEPNGTQGTTFLISLPIESVSAAMEDG